MAHAQDPEEVLIIGVIPSGAGLDKSKIPFPVQNRNASDIENANPLNISDFLRQSFTSVSLNDAQNNPCLL